MPSFRLATLLAVLAVIEFLGRPEHRTGVVSAGHP